MIDPSIIDGGLAVDDRGELVFANDLLLSDYKRFYVIKNHTPQFVRAWHGHKKESKAIVVLQGSALVGAVAIDDWENPSTNLKVHRYVLSAKKPQVLLIPAGFANGIMTLVSDSTVLVFSSSTLQESSGDDFRFPSRYWDIWQVEER